MLIWNSCRQLDEITTLLRYASFENFTKHFTNEQDRSFPYGHQIIYQKELSAIESILAEAFTILFYLGLLRYNKHFESLYPFTTEFIPLNPNTRFNSKRSVDENNSKRW
jgi:hypothetical protein